MNCSFMKPILSSAKTLLGKKSTKDILKYLAKVTISHICRKYGLSQQKYDSNDMKNMIYHYNNNNNNLIDKKSVDEMISIMNINRFVNDVDKSNSNEIMDNLINNLSSIIEDNNIIKTYNDVCSNNIVKQFDLDTIETTSIADSYEINSGGIYVPKRDVATSTIEGCKLADAKNEYLEKRLELGENASKEDVENLVNDYYQKIDFEKVLKYFNN